MKQNMDEYIRTLNFELTLATKLRKAMDDVAAVVETGALFNKEIAGSSVVDMQMLLYNTRSMNQLKDKYMNTYKLNNNAMQTTARRVRNDVSQQIQNPTVSFWLTLMNISDFSLMCKPCAQGQVS